ncbi:class E sortase [Glycomyces sp. TRM65418]|uniref:class E sortase n=1 Tax=Glycomyces sp. TRM65418 TaxID=2867006 RepID=UPI001CE67EF6|nr:class E sortase [Glycomyces sp. TRM65418]MCC3764777.1 class E sortase [Glycomyces sp. TRM65418]QZD54431.1 class E sortase [Glycomyces sp. TRM65418]
MSDQDWSPFANEPPSRPRPSPGPAVGSGAGPGRASVPPPNGKAPNGQAPNSPVPGGPTPATPVPAGQRPSPPRPEGAPSPAGVLSPPAPYTPPSSPSPPSGGPRPSSGSDPDFDKTTALRPPGLARAHAPLVPEPDGTAILPVIPADETPAPPGADSAVRKKRSVKRHRGEGGLRNTVRGLGEALVTLGAVVLLYAAYEVFGVSQQINNEQQTLSTDLDTIWEEAEEGEDASQAVPELGDAFARMWAPDIRPESWTLVEGTEPADIEYAPGRYLDGAYPGEQGNFTLAGHNVPAIFQKIRDLEPGDKVVIETKDFFYVYEVQGSEVVNETQVDITAPVPRDPGAEPGEEDFWLTLFTCHPLWDNYERYVVYSQLVDTIDRDPEGDLPPAAVDPEA